LAMARLASPIMAHVKIQQSGKTCILDTALLRWLQVTMKTISGYDSHNHKSTPNRKICIPI